jgi:serine/threonine protein kinase
MRYAADLLASDQLRSFPFLLRKVLSICEKGWQKRSTVKERETRTMYVGEESYGSPGVAIRIQTPKQIKHAKSKSVAKLIGKTISHYRILSKLGIGGMGVIYRAQDVRLNRQVAVKFAFEEYQTNAAIRECFRSEAHAASAVNHPNVCRLYDVGEFARRPFLVMELLEGRTLRELIEVPLALEVFLNLAIQIADGLHAVHSSGIVHRDITPSNIHVSSMGCVKILDFGLAEFANAPVKPKLNSVERQLQQVVARPDRALGTVPYMSPEQILGESLDGRADLFSLGVVLYEMLTSERPFQGTTSAAVLDAVIRKPIVPVSALRPGLPDMLEKLIEKALEKDREYRCQSASELRADLKRLQRDSRLDRRRPANVFETCLG